ncbi:type II toxin-antitoxin system RelE/ParE family toxin [Spirosoma utsteinense]|uniref:Plasmid stabilization system protein ParE n=1 Tax=Spirosoma utsteinense TaxID=2585773 RepID=A0ABR6W9P7_9BACT|nr:type II toxin-antitoxin system RelE/ParE family toxin [Spirosoma utsteinense]MBC3787636.1 plasmid stabilization system protein ParE [Spirosoma utsteinense]MBC3793232.1 plasmid stabilization system protein ParE [Spirosoma utsteinense]
MAREIAWTSQAQEDYRAVVSYLLDTFGDEVAEKYTDRLFNVLNSIAAMPQMGRQHPQLSAIRQVIMKPYTVICYLVLPDQLKIVNLLDSRSEQNR